MHGSGGWSWYSGWINVFFPIIHDKKNEYCVPYQSSCDYIQSGFKNAGRGNDVNDYPNGLSLAPVKWQYYNLQFKFKFIGGFLGVGKDKQNGDQLSPTVGWIIGEQTRENQQTVNHMATLEFQE